MQLNLSSDNQAFIEHAVAAGSFPSKEAALDEAVRFLRAPGVPSGARAGDELQRHFAELAKKWREETSCFSSASEIAIHPAYQQIIGLGLPVVPLILKELQRKPEHWFWALNAITGADPVPAALRGKVDAMAAKWLEWGNEAGFVGGNGSLVS